MDAQKGPSRKRKFRRRGKRIGATEKPVNAQKAPLPGACLTYQGRLYYQILSSSAGVRPMCEVIFKSMQLRNYRMAVTVTLHQLEYVTSVAFLARLASVAIEYGYVTDQPELSVLIDTVVGLQLPAILARYIETIGVLELANGANVAPWFGTREQMFNPHLRFANPDVFLQAAGRPIPGNHWSIDSNWIVEWNKGTGFQRHFRPIRWSNTTGSIEMVVTPLYPTLQDPDVYRPTAPQQMLDTEAQLGTIYRWRCFDDLQYWPENTALVCTRLFYGTEVYPNELWAQLIVDSYTENE